MTSRISIGARGAEVCRIQERLNGLDLYRGPLDGMFDLATESAVIIFQVRERFPVDGIVSSVTWQRLFPQNVSDYACTYKQGEQTWKMATMSD